MPGCKQRIKVIHQILGNNYSINYMNNLVRQVNQQKTKLVIDDIIDAIVMAAIIERYNFFQNKNNIKLLKKHDIYQRFSIFH